MFDIFPLSSPVISFSECFTIYPFLFSLVRNRENTGIRFTLFRGVLSFFESSGKCIFITVLKTFAVCLEYIKAD